MIAEPAPRVARHRLFFALWPDEALRERIGHAVQPKLAGRRARKVPSANLHVTLAFLGAVLDTDLAKVVDAGDRTHGEPFEFTIDRLESWRAAHVACLMIEPVPGPMAALVERLRLNLSEHGIDVDRKDFRAHVTVARDWREQRLEERIGPFTWCARDFVLVASQPGHDGSEYRVLRRWALRGADGA